MPVDERTVQPFRILHGGASVALAETLCSVGAWANIPEGKTAVGIEINANHHRSVAEGGKVTATSTPSKLGEPFMFGKPKSPTNEGNLCVLRDVP